jgi:spectinomycin phosphotransferase
MRTLIDEVTVALRSNYGIEATAVERTERGKDFFASVFQVSMGESIPRYVVKVRRAGAARQPAAAVARHLADSGVPGIVAPVRTLAGTASAASDRISLVVYPFIAGRLGIGMPMSDDAWRGLGRFARRLHQSVLPAELAAVIPREPFEPPGIETIPQVDAAVAAWTTGDAASRRVAELWRDRRDKILELTQRARVLGDTLRQRALPAVPCHADMHTGNLIIDTEERVWVIDWDEVVLAPRERDLMFVVGGGISTELVSPNATARFLDGYGAVDIDPEALAYYRHAWAVQDVGGWAWRVLLDESATDPQRDEAAEIFVGLFRPGEIVDLAARSIG